MILKLFDSNRFIAFLNNDVSRYAGNRDKDKDCLPGTDYIVILQLAVIKELFVDKSSVARLFVTEFEFVIDVPVKYRHMAAAHLVIVRHTYVARLVSAYEIASFIYIV